ncbi:hypothetical protein HX004_06185 [Myroides sp. 1354]|uniref:hypothetical protein n=1 Tax=unclassified Myroides TaxID=2642485 RepID=UPI0025762062|nr:MULTISPECIES: hypothetical protein [unclassified Myroides]MDM1044649.1 hypothetical protein [Myroides sp. R163-1]MDM1055362.1 hypothetical protein [Myroides sp. 1354]MDM1068659.1 hypothetical protein [Myroides sp. 1372]
MNKISILCMALLSLTSCAQKKVNKEDIMTMEHVQNVLNSYKIIKTYDYNPDYTLHIEKAANYTFELLVNDFPVFINYDPGALTGSIPINEAILQAGQQSITVRMTPPVNEEFNMSASIDLALAELKLAVEYGDYGREKTADFKEVFRYELPALKGEVPTYEIKLHFEAPLVPYENDIIGWQQSVDLSQEDEGALFQEVEAFYKEMIALYETTRDVNGLAAKYYKRRKDIAQCYYSNKAWKAQKIIDEWIKDVNDERPFLFSGYVMKLYGNGRLVKLAKIDDKYYLNYSALIREDEDGNAVQYYMFLHRPKPGAPLEVIR